MPIATKQQITLIDSILEGKKPTKDSIINCDLEYSDNKISTPLITAVMMGNKDWVLFLLDNGANIYTRECSGDNVFTALEKSPQKDSQEMKSFLLNYNSPEEAAKRQMKQQMYSFAMGTNDRLGSDSPVKILKQGKDDIMPLIAQHLANGKDDKSK